MSYIITKAELEHMSIYTNAVVFSQDALGLVPEIFDAVDMVAALVDEGLTVIDPAMSKAGYVENIVARQGIRIDEGMR